jgi:hypothetical protein
MVTTDPILFRPSAHLDRLLAEVDELADLARTSTPPDSVVAAARERTLVATLQLDGSPIRELPSDLDVPAGRPGDTTAGSVAGAATGTTGGSATGTAGGSTTGTAGGSADGAAAELPASPSSWYTSFRMFEEAPEERIVALEALGVDAAYASDDLTARFPDEPIETLRELHRRLTAGLLDPDRAGKPRTTEQAVQDTSVGRVLYYTVHPQIVAEELEQLGAWLARPATRLAPLHGAGLLHLEILRIHPFEAANGRLARVAARMWLRRGGLDPHRLAVAEPELAADALGYHEEVAGTLRRRDAAIWLERWGEAVAAGLRRHAREAGWLAVELPWRAASFLDDRAPASRFTVADYREHVDGDADRADEDLRRLLDAGAVTRAHGGRGLRFVVA